MTDDLISRQEAICALGYRPMVWSRKDEYTLGQRDQYDADKFAIEHLESVQPNKGKWADDYREALVNVSKGQDPYSVIGNYILNHVTAIEDIIAVIQIDGIIINELYMVDVDADGYFYWDNDWWEGEEDVALLDFFPVSDAEPPERKKGKWIDDTYCSICGWANEVESGFIGSVKGFKFCPNCGKGMEHD